MTSELKEVLDAIGEIGIELPPGIDSFRELCIGLRAYGPVVKEAEADRDEFDPYSPDAVENTQAAGGGMPMMMSDGRGGQTPVSPGQREVMAEQARLAKLHSVRTAKRK